MKLSKLTLTNFKKHRSLQADFDESYNLVTGNNYQGKSTLLQGMLVGLFGSSALNGTSSDLTHTGEKDFSILIEFNNGLTVKRTAKTCEVQQDGEILARTHSACNSLIEEVIGIPKKQFMLNYYSKQGDAQVLVDMDGAELTKHLENCIGIEQIQDVIKGCNSAETLNKGKAEALSHQVLPVDEVVSLESEIKVGEGELESLKRLLDALDVSLEDANTKESEALAQYQAISESFTRWNAYHVMISAAKAVIEDTPEPEVPSSHWAEAYTSKMQYENYAEKARTLRKNIEAKEAALLGHQQGLSALEEPRESLSNRLTEIANLSAEAAVKIKALKAKLIDSECPTCKRPYDTNIIINKIKIQEEIDSLIAEKDGYLEELTSIKQREKDNQDLMIARNKLESHVASYTKLLEEFKKELDNLQQPDGEESSLSLKEIKSKEREAAQAETLREKAYKDMQTPTPEGEPVTQQQVDAQFNNHKDLASKRVTFSDSRAELAEEHTALTYSLKDAHTNLKRHIEAKAMYQGFLKKVGTYAKLKEILQEVRQDVTVASWDRVLGICTDFVSSCTGGDVNKVYLSEKGLRYQEHGNSRSVQACASGAQKTLIGLGLKMGLSNISPSLVDFVLFDEPTADMSEEISSACMSLLGQYCEQVVAVTHRQMDTADFVINL